MKHLLYFAGYRMVVLRWQNNTFLGRADFEPDAGGLAAFERLLQQEVEQPLRLLIDILEEDFRVETTPHLIGRDRAAVHARILNKYFRQYPHKSLRVQSRQEKSRRDDVVLLSALTNPGLFKPWLDILHKHKIPLEGIYSLPLVGEALIKSLGGEPPRNMLVISQQVPGNIRQSFYMHGKLKLSRLAPSSDDPSSYYEVLEEETERTIRYLENQHLIGSNEPLEVFMVAPPAAHARLNDIFVDDTRKRFHMLNRDSLAQALGVREALPDEYCSWLYAHILLKDKRLQYHYGTADDRKYFYHYQTERGLYAFSIAVFLMASFYGLFLLGEGYLYSQQREDFLVETKLYERRYQESLRDISSLNLDIEKVRDAVTITEELAADIGRTPYKFMQILSSTLEQHAKVEIKTLKWLVTDDPQHSFGEKKKELDRRTLRLLQTGQQRIIYEKAMVEAVVTEYEENPRIAVERMYGFIESLRKSGLVDAVEIMKMPFDIDPASRIVGQGIDSSMQKSEARFVFVMIKQEEVK
jgi:hypothetical protein